MSRPLPAFMIVHELRFSYSILVVDDHDDLRNYITSILGGICRSVTGVSDGEAALRILKTNVSWKLGMPEQTNVRY